MDMAFFLLALMVLSVLIVENARRYALGTIMMQKNNNRDLGYFVSKLINKLFVIAK